MRDIPNTNPPCDKCGIRHSRVVVIDRTTDLGFRYICIDELDNRATPRKSKD